MKFFLNNKNKYKLPNGLLKIYKNIIKELVMFLKIEKKYYFELHFVSEYFIKKINKDHRNKNYITDVITFSFLEKNNPSLLLGEIYICYNKCLKQAIKYKKTNLREFSFIFLHGVLHLLNFDHQNIEDEKIMFDIQNYILKKINI